MSTLAPPPLDTPPQPAPPPPASGRTARTVWLVIGGVLAVGMLGWGTLNIVELLAHEEFTVTETFDAAAIERLDVDTDNGRISVVGADVDQVTVTAHVSTGLRDTGNSARLIGADLRLRGSCPNFGSTWCSVDYDIEVPVDFVVDAHSDNSRISISNVNGRVSANGDNGSITLRSLSGPIDVSTDNGSITGEDLTSRTVTADSDNGSVRLRFLEAPDVVTASTDNGDVEVIVPEIPEGYALTLDTDNGSQHPDIRTDPASAHTIALSSDNGDVTARYP